MIDEQREKMLALVSRVRRLCVDDHSESQLVIAAEELADAAADLDAMLSDGGPLPLAWREQAHLSREDRLMWICRKVWGRYAGEAVKIRMQEDGLTDDRGALGRRGYLAFCSGAPKAVWGETRERALTLLAIYGAAEVASIHGVDDCAASEVLKRLRELGIDTTPGSKDMEPFMPVGDR